MKTLTPKTRYIANGDSADLYAKPKVGPQRWIRFATCHIATVKEIKERGISACAPLLTLVGCAQLGKKSKLPVLPNATI